MGHRVALKYIELKTGYNDNGPAWIARVKVSKSGRGIGNSTILALPSRMTSGKRIHQRSSNSKTDLYEAAA